eukprot:CAMPEP_0194296956 /NCGR_PEP_ID=MMETSP0169-20130528/57572_1 /TAXON_ID=218684 /ORGANISM="Corethron pennatum, Strain L29A3" /LENGTH=112 /DNA_ID=CAMNT_0039046607 /DNA_START=506 /DNA_END=844 /DNA_ORIENTATION=-
MGACPYCVPHGGPVGPAYRTVREEFDAKGLDAVVGGIFRHFPPAAGGAQYFSEVGARGAGRGARHGPGAEDEEVPVHRGGAEEGGLSPPGDGGKERNLCATIFRAHDVKGVS